MEPVLVARYRLIVEGLGINGMADAFHALRDGIFDVLPLRSFRLDVTCHRPEAALL